MSDAIYTVGHSNRTADAFFDVLAAHAIETLVAVRTIPRSKRNPQFEGLELTRSLLMDDIGYRYLPDLGGLRHPVRDSLNGGWRICDIGQSG